MTSEQLKHVCGTDDKLSLLLRGGQVIRYHAEGDRVAKQKVSDHTWRMLILLLYIWPHASRDLILAVIYHDVAEVMTGDPSAMLKSLDSGLSAIYREYTKKLHNFLGVIGSWELQSLDKDRLKTVDYLECFMTSHYQSSPEAKQIGRNALALVRVYMKAFDVEEYARIDKLITRIELQQV